jgi:hypothetical protein
MFFVAINQSGSREAPDDAVTSLEPSRLLMMCFSVSAYHLLVPEPDRSKRTDSGVYLLLCV